VNYLAPDLRQQQIISNLDATQAIIDKFPGSTFLPVTKGKSIEILKVAIEWGVTKMGENYLQEAIPKIVAIKQLYPNKNIDWYFIGTLQSKKVKKVVQHFNVIETVDREKTFYRIVRYAKELNKPLKIMIEVNSAAEESKSGLSYHEIVPFLESIKINEPEDYHPVVVDGFMTIGALNLEKKEKLKEFKEFVSTARKTRREFPVIGEELSFGMSGDYRMALEEGSTEVRLGTLLFGMRE
jgi:pyridoxal phosphate enzyme (YggS family)